MYHVQVERYIFESIESSDSLQNSEQVWIQLHHWLLWKPYLWWEYVCTNPASIGKKGYAKLYAEPSPT